MRPGTGEADRVGVARRGRGVPNEEMRIGKPVAYASIILSWPITRPTWPGAVAVPSAPAKKTRSPGSTWLAGTCGPHSHCSCEVRGMYTPAAR